MAKPILIRTDDAEWHILRYGSGPEVLVTFHGFSQDASFFSSLKEPLSHRYTIWSVDMPGHGSTIWESRKICTPRMILDLISGIREEAGVEKVDLMGFSMGGRYAWVFSQEYPQYVHQLFLAATEGLTPNYGINLFTTNPPGRWLLHQFIDHPGMITGPAKLIYRLGLVSEKLYQFVLLNVGSKELRTQLETSWMAMRGLKPDTAKLAAAVKKHGIGAYVIVGERDPLIKVSDAKKLADQLDPEKLVVVPKGHFVIDVSLGRRSSRFGLT